MSVNELISWCFTFDKATVHFVHREHCRKYLVLFCQRHNPSPTTRCPWLHEYCISLLLSDHYEKHDTSHILDNHFWRSVVTKHNVVLLLCSLEVTAICKSFSITDIFAKKNWQAPICFYMFYLHQLLFQIWRTICLLVNTLICQNPLFGSVVKLKLNVGNISINHAGKHKACGFTNKYRNTQNKFYFRVKTLPQDVL